MNKTGLSERVEGVKSTLDMLGGERNIIKVKRDNLVQEFNSHQNTRIRYIGARELLEMAVRSTEVSLQRRVEPIVTEGLNFVFNQGMFFHIVFVPRRNQIENDFVVFKKVEEDLYQKYIQNPQKYEIVLEQLIKESKNIIYSFGGAINQTIALILRFIVAELIDIEGPIFLDEPSSAIAETYSSRLGQLISSLSERYNRQYVLITHSITLASFAEKRYNIVQGNYISKAYLLGEGVNEK